MGKAGDTAQGAASGAAMGAPLGPWGMAAGAALGGAYGYFSSPDEAKPSAASLQAQQDADWARTHLKTSMEQHAPSVNTGMGAYQTDQTRGQQGQLASLLFAQAQGTAPGPGELAVQRGAHNAMANQASMAQMARGAGAGMAQRNAARASADIGTNAAGQGSIAQMQDKSNSMGQLGSLLGMTRGQDLSQRGQNINIAQGNQQTQMQQQGQNLQALQQLLGTNQAQTGQANAEQALALAQQQQRNQQMASLMQAGGQVATAYGTGTGGGANDPSKYWQGSTRTGSLYQG